MIFCQYPPQGIDNRILYESFSLTDRRKIHQIIYLLKIVKGIIDSPNLLQSVPLFVPPTRLRQPPVFRYTATNTFSFVSRLNVMENYTDHFLRAKADTVDLFADSLSCLCNSVLNYVTADDNL